MNRKIMAVGLVAAMMIASTAMCAAADGPDGPPTEPEASDTVVSTMPQGTPAYARHDAVVKEVTDGAVLLDIGEELPETATVSDETVFLTAAGETTDVSAVKAGDKVSVFVDGDVAVPLIYPAQYPASCIVLGDGENYAGVDIDVYSKSDSLGMYINGANTLAINVDENTSIVTANGSRIYIDYTDLAGRNLAVFYSAVTMSIPGIANPTRVVVLPNVKAETPAIGTAPASVPAYARHDAAVQEVTDDGILLDIGEDLPETAFVSDETVFLTAAGEKTDISAVKAGDKVSVFVDGEAIVTLIYPAQYPASYVVLGDGENYAGVDIDAYAESDSLGMYVNGANTLAINVDENTAIAALSGDEVSHTDLAGKKLAVYYSAVTMSIPGIANPTKVVVLGDAGTVEDREADAPVCDTYIDLDPADAVTTDEGVVMIPVRKYAESLGYEVGWTPDAPMSVTIGTVPMGVSIELGVNSYSKARMTPFVLEAAPYAAKGKTYVPVSFFEQVLEVGVKTPRG